MKIVIIGTGNVATIFGNLLKKAGHHINQVFGRNPVQAALLAGQLDAQPCWEWSGVDKQADLYFVAISDQALVELHLHLVLSDQIIVHTAGAVSQEVLKEISANYGVLYPLQSLKKGMPIPSQIPLLIDANTEETKNKLLQVGADLSNSVMIATDEQRRKYHVAAVFINNFTNHLYALAESYCRGEDIPFNLSFPLAAETAARLQSASPAQVVTGPAIRGDESTIRKHLELLHHYPVLYDMYAGFTKSIRQWYKK